MQNIIRHLETQPMTRILALGSSNTELAYHCKGRHNWFDWLEVGIREHYGRKHICINSGVSGNTSADILDRFDRDCALFQPNVVILTVGGNDSNPGRGVSSEEFHRNLAELVGRISAFDDCRVILQTYYAFDIEKFAHAEKGWADNFPIYMDITCKVAAETNCPLLNHLERWEKLRRADIALFRNLMLDSRHVNPLGNMVIGLDILREFGVRINDRLLDLCREGLSIQQKLDELTTR